MIRPDGRERLRVSGTDLRRADLSGPSSPAPTGMGGAWLPEAVLTGVRLDGAVGGGRPSGLRGSEPREVGVVVTEGRSSRWWCLGLSSPGVLADVRGALEKLKISSGV